MAIKKTIFVECGNESVSAVFQYNDLYFTPGSSALYNGTCYSDTKENSPLVPIADVTFNGYEDCNTCISASLSGITIQNCSSSEIYNVTIPSTKVPNIGQFVSLDGQCWEVISYTSTTSQIQTSLSTYESCEDCTNNTDISDEYSFAEFVNCCNSSDSQVFNIISSNFVYPFGSTVVYNSQCYSYLSASTGTAVATFTVPDYYNCNECSNRVPCASPSPTPTVTATPSLTPSPTPTVSVSPTITPTPSKTPGLSPTPSYVVTTTTRSPFRNECEPITLLPLGVDCVATDPTTFHGANGSIYLNITGGTPPYTIIWDNGITNVNPLSGLVHGTYSATVYDYWGDFTGVTICSVTDPTPTPTVTPTMTPTPSVSSAAQPNLCLTVAVSEYGLYQFEFTPYSIINGLTAWSASTAGTVITNGTPLILHWNNPGPSVSSTPVLGYWSIDGWNAAALGSYSFYLSTSTTSVPPLSGWNVVGTSPGVNNPNMISGSCPTYVALSLTTNSNNASCESVTDGSICLVGQGGSGNYEYSIDGGSTYMTSNCFYNLGVGSYACYLRDTTTSLTATATVTIAAAATNTSVQIGFTQTSSTIVTNTSATFRRDTSYSMNTSSIPNGVTLAVSFDLEKQFKEYQPGGGDNTTSSFVILKNGSPISISTGSSTSGLQNRPGCSPYKIDILTTDYTSSTTVTNADTLVIEIVNKVTVSSPGYDNGCSTKVENIMSVTSNFTYSGVSPCVTINSGNLSVNSTVSRTLGS